MRWLAMTEPGAMLRTYIQRQSEYARRLGVDRQLVLLISYRSSPRS